LPERRILLGVIGRPHGVRGLLHVTSHTADPTDLTAYGPLSDATGKIFSVQWRGAGIAEIFEHVDGHAIKVTDRDAAAKLTNTQLFIYRDRLPPPDADEFYFSDLVGLEAVDSNGAPLGKVATVHDYGAGTSLEVVGENISLIVPFTRACVPVVDLAAHRVVIVPPGEIIVPGSEAAA
jgi:16S rRNA processing protein RimM